MAFAAPREDCGVFCKRDSAGRALEVRRKFCGSENITLDGDLAASTKGLKKLRIREYLKSVDERAGQESNAVCCDLGQNWEAKRGAASAYFPSAVRNAEQVVFMGSEDKAGHVLTPSELDFARGWPAILHHRNRDWAADLQIPFQCNHLGGEHRSLHGNAIHLPAYAMWYSFFMAHTVRRDTILEYMPDSGNQWQVLMASSTRAAAGSSGSRQPLERPMAMQAD